MFWVPPPHCPGLHPSSRAPSTREEVTGLESVSTEVPSPCIRRDNPFPYNLRLPCNSPGHNKLLHPCSSEALGNSQRLSFRQGCLHYHKSISHLVLLHKVEPRKFFSFKTSENKTFNFEITVDSYAVVRSSTARSQSPLPSLQNGNLLQHCLTASQPEY